jgi:CheY-like chemotaxis protein
MSAGELGSGDLFSASVAKPVKHDMLFDILMESMGGARRSSSRSQPKPVERLGELIPLSILAAEDNPVNQKLLLRVLKEIGYQADVVPNGVEVINAVKKKPYDIIFMDVHMPEMDGLEATRLIMSIVPREKRPVIIAVTADALEGDREKCMQAGMDDYITKPIRIADIEGVLQRWSTKAASLQPQRQSPPDFPSNEEFEQALSDRIRQLGLETDPEFVVELIDSYAPLFSNQSRSIEEAFSKQDEAKLRYAAHSLKGASLNIGANKLGAICRSIEDLADKKDFASAAKLLPELKEVIGKTSQALDTIKARLSKEIRSGPDQATKG